MRIMRVAANNRRKAFEVVVGRRTLVFPYAQVRLRPSPTNRVDTVYVDQELGAQAFTYTLQQGETDTVHLDEVLEYNADPAYFHELMLYELTLEVHRAVAATELSKREIIRRLGTSASQFYRLLDQTNYTKSIGQLLTLMNVLGWQVQLVVKPKSPREGRSRTNRREKRRPAA
jgi:hypothetical protein